jgi:hypothetical protein
MESRTDVEQAPTEPEAGITGQEAPAVVSEEQTAPAEPEVQTAVEYTVTIDRRSDSIPDSLKEIAETVALEFAKKLKRNIELKNYTGASFSRLNEEPGVLKIKFFTTVKQTDRTEIDDIYEFETTGSQDSAYTPSGELLTVYDQNGTAVAEFSEGTINVLFALPYGDHCKELFSRILDDFCDYCGANGSKRAKKFPMLMKKRLSNVQHVRFNKMFTSRLEDSLEEVDGLIKGAEENLRRYQEKIIDGQREWDDLNHRKMGITYALKTISKKKILKEYENLRALSVTGEIEVGEYGVISIPVGQIDIYYEGQTYDIGDFVVEIHTSGEYGGVKCFNKTRTKRLGDNSYFHPHIKSSGHVCLGNISGNVAKLISLMEYGPVVLIMIDFLHTVNPKGWYKSIDNWPIKEAASEQSDSTNPRSTQ